MQHVALWWRSRGISAFVRGCALCCAAVGLGGIATAQRGKVESRPHETAHIAADAKANIERSRQNARVKYIISVADGQTSLLKDGEKASLAFVESLSDGELTVLKERARNGRRGLIAEFLREDADHGLSPLPFSEELRSRSPKKPVPAFRDRFSKWLSERFKREREEIVRSLDGISKWQLDSFITQRDQTIDISFEVEVAHLSEWLERRQSDLAAARKHFDAALREGEGAVKSPDEFLRSTDFHEAKYSTAAHRAYIKEHPALDRLQIEGWKFDATSLSDLGSILSHLGKPLPGDQPALVYVLDTRDGRTKTQVEMMNAAWDQSALTRSKPEFLEHDDVDRFVQGYSGKTLIMVGHIDGPSFVTTRGGGKAPLVIDIGLLLERAEVHGVLLVPLGCRSARTAATYGFLREIDTAEVAIFLSALPASNATIGDLFAAAAKIAPIEVKGAQLADHLEAVLRAKSAPRDSREPLSTAGEMSRVVTVIRIPRSALTAPQSMSSLGTYQASMVAEMDRIRPWTDQGFLKAWRSAYRSSPIWTLLLSAIGLLVTGLGINLSAEKIERPTKPPMRNLRLVSKSLLIAAGLLFGGALLRLVVEVWPAFVVLLILFGIALLSESSKSAEPTQRI